MRNVLPVPVATMTLLLTVVLRATSLDVTLPLKVTSKVSKRTSSSLAGCDPPLVSWLLTMVLSDTSMASKSVTAALQKSTRIKAVLGAVMMDETTREPLTFRVVPESTTAEPRSAMNACDSAPGPADIVSDSMLLSLNNMLVALNEMEAVVLKCVAMVRPELPVAAMLPVMLLLRTSTSCSEDMFDAMVRVFARA